MFAAVASHMSSFNLILSSVTKMMNVLLVERDWLGLLLVESSCILIFINVRFSD